MLSGNLSNVPFSVLSSIPQSDLCPKSTSLSPLINLTELEELIMFRFFSPRLVGRPQFENYSVLTEVCALHSVLTFLNFLWHSATIIRASSHGLFMF